MKKLIIILWVILVLLSNSFAYAMESDYIYHWVAKELNLGINKYVREPIIMRLNDEVFNKCFIYKNSGTEEMVASVLGFYDPKNRVIWLREDSSDCILAHEYTHFFQHIYFGNLNSGRDYIERQAEIIEIKFCNKHKED